MSSITYKDQNIELAGVELEVGDNAPRVVLRTKKPCPSRNSTTWENSNFINHA